MLLPLLLVLFFGSGISGLIYELVWLRYLSLIFGVTIYAVSTVLSAFMGGLALGGYLAGRFAERVRRPLRAYGVMEIAIGLSALLTPPAFGLLQEVYRGLYPALPHDLTTLSLVRFVLACLVLLLPTTLMGATLPIVIRSTLGRTRSLGANLSLLYASNTAGGITGAYLAGFVLIGSIGIQATTVTAAFVNVAVGLLAIALDAWGSRAPSHTERSEEFVTNPTAEQDRSFSALTMTDGALRLLLAAFFISGFASLGYQVIWTRILAIYFEATTYAFTLILCTFLLGIALGSYAITPLIERRANWLFTAAVMEWAIGLTALISIAVISRLGQIVEALRWVPLLEHTVSGEQRVIALMCFVTIIPTTLLLGAAFPIIMKLYAGSGDARITRRLGRAYAANVCGSIAGSWASGFVLIPLLGTHRSLVLLAAANVIVGLALLRYALTRHPERRERSVAPDRPPSSLRPSARGALTVGGLALALGATALTPDLYGAVFSRFGDRVLWYEEGLEQTVTILQGEQVRRMYLNGWHQANDTPQMLQLHTLIGHLPMLVQPTTSRAERKVLVIGLGGGATAGAAAAHRGAQLQVVELSPSVVRGATFFAHVNGDVVSMRDGRVQAAPNVTVHEDDGRNYLLLSDDTYDVIMADAIRPRAAGSGALYSYEYYRLARSALAEDGVMVQWIDTEIPATQYKILLRTFLEAFPHVTAWAGGALFVGSERPYRVDPATVAQRLAGANPRLLAPTGLTSAESVLNLYLAGDADLRAWVGTGPVITDNHPYNEFFRSLPDDDTRPDFGSLRKSGSP